MHYSQLYVLARHGENDALRGLLRRTVDEQLLFANCNSEISVKGDQRSSKCFVEQKPDNRSRLVKDTPVISYGEYADALLITARRSEDADDKRSGITRLRTSGVRAHAYVGVGYARPPRNLQPIVPS